MERERKRVFRGDRLRKIREAREMSQEDLNNRLGFDNTRIYRYEVGRAEPTPDVIVRLAKEFGITTDYLLGLVDSPHEQLESADLSAAEIRLLDAWRSKDIRALNSLLSKLPE